MMKLIKTREYLLSLQSIMQYIAKDNKSAALNFRTQLNKKLKGIKDNPKMYRQSLYHNDETYRDLTFKGYTTIYKIDETDMTIKVLDIFKWVNR